MKLMLISLLAFAVSAPNVYPVGARIETIHWKRTLGYERGWGHGNVKDGNRVQGFDFQFSGCGLIEASHGPEFIAARWGSPHDLVIRTADIGSDKTKECTLHVTLRDFVYQMKNGVLSTKPLD